MTNWRELSTQQIDAIFQQKGDLIASQSAEIDRLRAALKPFAKVADDFDCWDEVPATSMPLMVDHCTADKEQFTIADLREARKAFNEQKGR